MYLFSADVDVNFCRHFCQVGCVGECRSLTDDLGVGVLRHLTSGLLTQLTEEDDLGEGVPRGLFQRGAFNRHLCPASKGTLEDPGYGLDDADRRVVAHITLGYGCNTTGMTTNRRMRFIHL